MSYFFFAATLPVLDFGSPPPFQLSEFMGRCREALSPDDMAEMERIAGSWTNTGGGRFVAALGLRETELRNAVARERARRLGVSAESAERPCTIVDPSIRRGVADAMARGNPRETELALDRLRWSVVEELQGFDPFSSEAVLAYGAKLRLLERWNAMDQEKGRGAVEAARTGNRPADALAAVTGGDVQ